ncbi:MAG: AMP-binding protein [Smithellaceae bacterium]
MDKISLALLLEESANKYADRTVLISDDKRVIYSQLNRNVNAVAHLLSETGVVKGDKVALMLPNIPEFFYCYFAAVKLGAVAVPLNTSSTPYELNYLLENSDAKVLMTVEAARKRYEEIQNKLSTCQNLITVDSPAENSPFRRALKSGNFSNPGETISPDDPAAIIYTSGLTGKSLGAVLTHRNLCSQSHLIHSCVKRTHLDIGLSLIPLFHSFGSTVNMINVIRTGCSVVMMDRFTMDGLFSAIQKEKITYICAVPRLYLGMMFHEGAANYDVSSLDVCVTGGAPMPAEFIPGFENQFGVKVVEGYGLTEASPACSFNMLDRPQKPGSIGMAVPGTKIRIVDENGWELPRGEIGELIVKGDNVMQGYYKDKAATAAVIKNGWLYTGDLGKMDNDDYVFLTGLKKRMIITSGFNVYPKEVEDVLNMHPAVQAVRVLGKQDLMRGEIVKAEIVKNDGSMIDEKEILKYCRIYLSPYKVPREVEFVRKLDI